MVYKKPKVGELNTYGFPVTKGDASREVTADKGELPNNIHVVDAKATTVPKTVSGEKNIGKTS